MNSTSVADRRQRFGSRHQLQLKEREPKETEILGKFWTALLAIFAIAAISIDGTAIAATRDICDQNDTDTIKLKGEFSFFTIYDEPHKKIAKPGKYWTV